MKVCPDCLSPDFEVTVEQVYGPVCPGIRARRTSRRLAQEAARKRKLLNLRLRAEPASLCRTCGGSSA